MLPLSLLSRLKRVTLPPTSLYSTDNTLLTEGESISLPSSLLLKRKTLVTLYLLSQQQCPHLCSSHCSHSHPMDLYIFNPTIPFSLPNTLLHLGGDPKPFWDFRLSLRRKSCLLPPSAPVTLAFQLPMLSDILLFSASIALHRHPQGFMAVSHIPIRSPLKYHLNTCPSYQLPTESKT